MKALERLLALTGAFACGWVTVQYLRQRQERAWEKQFVTMAREACSQLEGVGSVVGGDLVVSVGCPPTPSVFDDFTKGLKFDKC